MELKYSVQPVQRFAIRNLGPGYSELRTVLVGTIVQHELW